MSIQGASSDISVNQKPDALEINHGPIKIIGNNQLRNISAQEGWSGSGTKTNPFIIANYQITSGTYGIDIEDTTLFITIEANSFPGTYQNCFFITNAINIVISKNILGSDVNTGINLINSSVTVVGNTIKGQNGFYGRYDNNTVINNNYFSAITINEIQLENSFNATIESNIFVSTLIGASITLNNDLNSSFINNIVLNTGIDTITIQKCQFITLQSNIFSQFGVLLQESTETTVKNNTLLYGSIKLDTSNYNIIEKNNIANGSINNYAIILNYANNNTFYENYIVNTGSGLDLIVSSSNIFHKNYFSGMSNLIQGYDPNSSYNLFYENNFIAQSNFVNFNYNINYFNTSTTGNYWSNNNSTGPYMIYAIQGYNLTDYHPLTTQTFTPNTAQLIRCEVLVNNLIANNPTSTYSYVGHSITTIGNNTAGGFVTTTKTSSQLSQSTKQINNIILLVLVIAFFIGAGFLIYVRNTNKKYSEQNNQQYQQPPEQHAYSNSVRPYTNTQPARTMRGIPKFCPACYTKTEPGDRFCMICGHRL